MLFALRPGSCCSIAGVHVLVLPPVFVLPVVPVVPLLVLVLPAVVVEPVVPAPVVAPVVPVAFVCPSFRQWRCIVGITHVRVVGGGTSRTKSRQSHETEKS